MFADCGVDNCMGSNSRVTSFKRRHDTSYSTLTYESSGVDSETVDDWRSDWLLPETTEYDLCDIWNADMRQVCFSVYRLVDVLLFVGNQP